MGLEGKSTLIVGASRGIGRDTALVLAEAGARLVLVSRSLKACEDLADEVRERGGQAKAAAADVRDMDAMDAAVALAVESYGRLDLAFNNAGVLLGGSRVEDTPLERFATTLDINLGGVFRALRAQIPAMRATGGGAIVVNSAGSGLRGRPGVADYAASKWGVIGFCLSAAQEAAAQGIRINVVAPGYIATEAWMSMLGGQAETMASRVPLGRLGEGRDVAQAVAWLLSDQARYVVGAVLPVDGGLLAG